MEAQLSGGPQCGFLSPVHELGGNLCIADGKPQGPGVMEHPSFKEVRGSKWLGWNLNSGLSDFKVHALYMIPPSLTIPMEKMRAGQLLTPRSETKLTLT